MSGPAGWIYVALIGVTVLFQVGLALGMPWGAAAMGGKFPGRFPGPMRIAAVVQAAALTGLAAIVAVRSEILSAGWFETSRSLIWIVVVMSAVSAMLNWATPSRWERLIWGPVASVMLISSLVVAVT